MEFSLLTFDSLLLFVALCYAYSHEKRLRGIQKQADRAEDDADLAVKTAKDAKNSIKRLKLLEIQVETDRMILFQLRDKIMPKKKK